MVLCFPPTQERWLYLPDSQHLSQEDHCRHPQKQAAALLVLSGRPRERWRCWVGGCVISGFFTLQETVRFQRCQAVTVIPMVASAASVMPLVSANARSVQGPAFYEVHPSPPLGLKRSQVVPEEILGPGHGTG